MFTIVPQLCVIRGSIPFGEWMRSVGHEVRNTYSWLIHGAVPLFCLFVWKVGKNAARSRMNHPLLMIIILQYVLAGSFWFAASLKVPVNFLAQAAYISFLPCLWFASSLDDVLIAGIVPFALI